MLQVSYFPQVGGQAPECHHSSVWRSKKSLWKSVLSSHHVGHGYPARAVRLGLLLPSATCSLTRTIETAVHTSWPAGDCVGPEGQTQDRALTLPLDPQCLYHHDSKSKVRWLGVTFSASKRPGF